MDGQQHSIAQRNYSSFKETTVSAKTKIDPEFESLLPYMDQEAIVRLEGKIRTEGCREKLIRWKEENILIEGHHRFKICERLGVIPEFHDISFPDRDAVITWIVDNQLARRNLTESQKAYFIGKKYLQEKKTVGNPKLQFPHSEGIGETAEKVAKSNKVSRQTVERNATFTEAVDTVAGSDEKVKQAILNESSEASKKDVMAAAKVGGSIFCDRCQRVGHVTGCEKCKMLREENKEKAKATRGKPSANGKPHKEKPKHFSWEKYEKSLGIVVRGCNDVADAYPGEKKSDDFKTCLSLAREYVKTWKAWHRRLTGSNKSR